MSDEFYVGYAQAAPERLGRFVRGRVGLLLGLVALLAVTLAALLPAERGGRFEYGIERPWQGRIVEAPYPMLAVAKPAGGWSYLLLVARGKRGAQAEVAGLDGAAVELTGTLIERDGQQMLELAASPARRAEQSQPPLLPAVEIGRVALRGEIVDGKCHLGVMVPGEGRAHRGCALRCISGGAPPLLVARDPSGRTVRALLTDAVGDPVGERILHLVAQPVRVEGTLSRRGDLLYLAADPADVEPLE